ncbi:MAG: cation-translocating P-type ATPase [Lactococcus raffinolactis]|uniref:cation-translocating P-type ATPase n=1 Tax=Pseudolactococcus raffinolactis TaxID=1366 RepID=UPI003993B811
MEFYQQTVKNTLGILLTDERKGLNNNQVEANRTKYGANIIPQKKEDSYIKIFLKNFSEPIVIVLLGAALLSFISYYYTHFVEKSMGHGSESLYEAIAILLLIFINAVLGFWQEISARKSLNALKEMNSRYTNVLRDGIWSKIRSQDLVVGDIIKSEVGDFIEADVRWIETSELQVIETHLTGEPDSINKDTEEITTTVDIGDRSNMGYSGSIVANGQGIAIIVGTGEHTELGHIAELIQSVEGKKTPLQNTINKLTKTLMMISLGVVLVSLVFGIIKSGSISIDSMTSTLSTSIALAVASIPDALPAVLSIVLTIGATKMARKNGLIKSLSSVETLGATSYICSDKTGTLTKNEMTVVKYYDNGIEYDVSGLGYSPEGEIKDVNNDVLMNSEFLIGSVLCNDSTIESVNGKYKTFGNPTEIALNVLGQKAGMFKNELLKSREIIRTLPFTSNRKMMSVIVKKQDEYFIYTKGAPEILIEHGKSFLLKNSLDSSLHAKDSFIKVVDYYASKALRTLAVGYRKLSAEEAINANIQDLECNLIISGIAGIIDPPREEVRTSVEILKKSNIKVVMITGDHAKTAQAIATDLGIFSEKNDGVFKGSDIEKLTDDQLFEKVLTTSVYARVSPEHKQRVVKQLQRHGEIVAMTGDGVNDAPALRAADIGIAMGITGSEITKDSADLILLDDKFTTIEKSVEIGRTIFSNIKNFMRHELTTNIAEVLSLFLGLIFFTTQIKEVGVSTPTLTALMILWVNMVSDAIPSFSLGYDVAESNIMEEKPRDPKASILANYTWSRVLIRGIVMGFAVYFAFVWAAQYGMNSNQAQTVAFLTLVFGQLWHVFDARCSKTIYRRNPFGNKKLVLAVMFAGISSILVTVIPFFNTVMGTERLSFIVYTMVVFLPALPTLILSGVKEIFDIKIW